MASITANLRMRKYSKIIRKLLKAYDDRDTTVGEGFMLQGVHFEVHRFHPPLIYGRIDHEERNEGISLARVN